MVTIRPATPDDAGAIQAIYAPIVEKTVISFEEIPPTVAEMAERIEATSSAYPYLAAVVDGRVAGYAYATQLRTRSAYNRSVEVTAYVAEQARKTGVGGRLYRDLLANLHERGFHAAYGGITLPNEASVRLHESVGFEYLGTFREVGFKFGRWLDVGWWQRLIAEDVSRAP
jgi:phosphinothricin acetyltransferase